MRIIIEIEGVEVTVKDKQSKVPVPQALAAPTELAPPSKVLTAAPAIVARNAGPAPTVAGTQSPGAPLLPQLTVGPGISIAGAGGSSAGAAPTPPLDVSAVIETVETGGGY